MALQHFRSNEKFTCGKVTCSYFMTGSVIRLLSWMWISALR